jgi:hypothetical protein
MKTNTEKDEKICRACKRTLVGGSKFGLCPSCLNKYGSPVAALLIVGITSLGGMVVSMVLKNGGKVAKGAFAVIKLFIS